MFTSLVLVWMSEQYWYESLSSIGIGIGLGMSSSISMIVPIPIQIPGILFVRIPGIGTILISIGIGMDV